MVLEVGGIFSNKISMKLSIVSWNVRGLNCSKKRSMIKNILLTWNADVVCFQETKVEGDITDIVREVWGSRWVKYVQLEASGTKWGIVIMWDKRDWEGVISSEGMYSVSCSFTGRSQDFSWNMTGVYAPNDRMEREETWGEIGATRSLIPGPWVLCGDFNTVRYPSEKKNCRRINKAMIDFLISLKTWKWVTSDHSPLLLQSGEWEKTNSYFKFENWWLKTEGFNERVKTWWESFNYSGKPDFILVAKLKALKGKLKEWSKTTQGNLGMQKQVVLAQLAELEEIQDHRILK
ncbi:uncharacterized protein LOC132608294 [Lycium barbarum]|uniref:uncharacterized protein LOC132608294 n=1 Tax=Lycium barbarum TaxID=112863 RepID=UPI00293E6164|nr:uncharacterized protein LOC132608294 [Lycium barbarum]